MNDFKNLSFKEKLESIKDNNKKKLKKKGIIDDFIYLLDVHNNLYSIPIDTKKFFKNKDYKMIFKDILKTIIDDYEYDNKSIKHLFYISEGFFNKEFKDFSNLNLDTTFNETNANECLIIYYEDKLSMFLEFYDKISIEDQLGKTAVLSEKPIKKLEYSKLDPDDNLKGILTNILD